MSEIQGGRMADSQLSSEFKDVICTTFCSRGGLNKCNGCPADAITADTYKTMKIGDIIGERKKR